jgi:hypothetical protein
MQGLMKTWGEFLLPKNRILPCQWLWGQATEIETAVANKDQWENCASARERQSDMATNVLASCLSSKGNMFNWRHYWLTWWSQLLNAMSAREMLKIMWSFPCLNLCCNVYPWVSRDGWQKLANECKMLFKMGASVFHFVQSCELRDWEMLQYFGGGWGHFFTYWSLRDAIRKVQADDARYKDRNVEPTAKEKIRSNGRGDSRWREDARMSHHLEYTRMR